MLLQGNTNLISSSVITSLQPMVDYLDWKDKSGLDEIGVKGIAERFID